MTGDTTNGTTVSANDRLADPGGPPATRRRFLAGIGTAGALAWSTTAPVAAQSGDGTAQWCQYHGGPGRTGRADTEDPAEPSRVRWSLGIGQSGMHPVVSGSTVYVGDGSGNVLALALSDGAIEWRQAVSGTVQVAPAVRDGRVFVGTDAGDLVALDAASGERLWSRTLFDAASTPAITDDAVFVGSSGDGHGLFSFDPASGDLRWRTTFQGQAGGGTELPTPAVRGDTVLVNLHELGSPHGQGVAAVDAESGETRWQRIILDLAGAPSPPATGTNSAYGTFVDNVAAATAVRYSQVGGDTNWRTGLGYANEATSRVPSTVGEGLIYEAAPGHRCWAFDPNTGEVQWRFSVDGDGGGTGITATTDRIYFGANGRLVSVGARDGLERWAFDLPTGAGSGLAGSTPVLVGGGFLIQYGGTLYALDAGSGTPTDRPGTATSDPSDGPGTATPAPTDGGSTVTRSVDRTTAAPSASDDGARPESGDGGRRSIGGGLPDPLSLEVVSTAGTVIAALAGLLELVRGGD